MLIPSPIKPMVPSPLCHFLNGFVPSEMIAFFDLFLVNVPTKTSPAQKQTSCSNFYHQGPCLVLACWELSNVCCVKIWHSACYPQGETQFFWKPNFFSELSQNKLHKWELMYWTKFVTTSLEQMSWRLHKALLVPAQRRWEQVLWETLYRKPQETRQQGQSSLGSRRSAWCEGNT